MADSKIPPSTPADKPTDIPARPLADSSSDDKLDDNGDPWRHPPVVPKEEGPLESFARSVSETVTGPLAGKPGKPKA